MTEGLNPYALGTWSDRPEGRGEESRPGAESEPQAHEFDPEPENDPDTLGIGRDPDAHVGDFSRPDEYGRRALNTVRSVAKKNGYVPRTRISTRRIDPRDRSDSAPGYSGARPDPRDPQRIGDVMQRVLGELGWDDGMSAGRVLAEWDDIVGPAIAEHCSVVSLDEGVLVVTADSSAWAAQLRMLSAQLITTINERVGRNVVEDLRVGGPAVASWKKGRRTVNWRGPRDTYG